MQHIIGEIKVIVCESTSHIILVLIAALCKFLELRHDQVIASRSLAEWSHMIMDFFSSVNA